MVLFNLNFADPKVAIVNIVLILIIVAEVISGYKKGFFESGVRLIGLIVAVIGAYLLKNPISVFMYTHLPFFKFKGLFSGVSILNILVYEAIAFLLVFIVLKIIINIVAKITGLVDRILSLIFLMGIPGRILGALVGFIKAIVILYFAIFVFKIGCNMFGFEIKESLADDIVNMPVLKETFGDSLESLNEITALAKDYEDTKDKEEFNNKAVKILLKYDVITEENLQILIDSGKINSIDTENAS